MLLFLNPVARFFKSLRSSATPGQLATGATLGMVIGLHPAFCGVWWLALYALLLFNVSFMLGIVSAIVFAALGELVLDAMVSYPLGWMIIEQWGSDGMGNAAGPIGGLVKFIGESPLLSWTHQHHWLVMGSTVFTLLLAAPVWLSAKVLCTRIRNRLLAFAKTKTAERIRGNLLLRWSMWIFVGDVFAAAKAAEKLDKRRVKQEGKDEKKLDKLQEKARMKEVKKRAKQQAKASKQAAKEAKAGGVDRPVAATKLEHEKAAAEVAPEVTLKPKKTRTLRASVAVLTVILVLIPAGSLAMAFVYRNQIIENVLEGPVAEQMGMRIQVGGVDLDVETGTLTVSNFRIYGPATPELAERDGVNLHAPLFSAEELTGNVDPTQLGRLRLKVGFRAVSPQVTLVRMPDGRMNYEDPDAPREAQTFEAPPPADGEPVLDANGNQMVDPETGKLLWRNPNTGEIVASDTQPTGMTGEAEDYDPDGSSTWEETRRFMEEMVRRYNLDDPDQAWAHYEKIQQLIGQYGPAAASNDVVAADDPEKKLKADLRGMASYVTDPPAQPAPGTPRFWLTNLSLQDVSVRYVDLREDGDPTVKQESYAFDIRNVATERVLLNEPLMVLVARDLKPPAIEGLALQTLADPEPFLYGKALERYRAWQADQALPREQRQFLPDPRPLINCLLFRFDESIALDEVASIFRDEDDPPTFTSGSIAIQSAHPSIGERDWVEIGEQWDFIGEGVADPGTISANGRTQVPAGPAAIYAGQVNGVFIIQLKDVKLNRGAFDMPDVFFEVIELVLGGDYTSNWRFVIRVYGRLLGPSVRLLNDDEVLWQLKRIAVEAVRRLAKEMMGVPMQLLLGNDGMAEWVSTYGQDPAFFMVWEDGARDAAAAADRWQQVHGGEVPFRNVVTPLLFTDNKTVFLNRLAGNAVPVFRVIIIDKAEEVIGKVLEVLPLPENLSREELRDDILEGVVEPLVPRFTYDDATEKLTFEGEEAYKARAEQVLERLRTNMARAAQKVINAWVDAILHQVEAGLAVVINGLPDAAVPEDLDATLANGVREEAAGLIVISDTFDVSLDGAASDRVIDRIVANAAEALRRVLQLWVDRVVAGVETAVRAGIDTIPADALPSRFDKDAAMILLTADLADALRPEVIVSRSFDVEVSFDRDQAERELHTKLVLNTQAVLQALADGYIADVADAIADRIGGNMPEGWSCERLHAELSDGVADDMFRIQVDRDGKPAGVDPQLQRGFARLAENAGMVLPEVGDPLIDNLVAPFVSRVDSAIDFPGDWTAERLSTRLKQDVVRAWLPRGSVSLGADGSLQLQPDNAAAEQVIRQNLAAVAPEIGQALADGLVQESVDTVLGHVPGNALPTGVTRESIATELSDGMGEEVVSVDGDDVAFDLDAGRDKIDRNALRATQEVMDAYVADLVTPIVDAIAAAVDPLPADYGKPEIRADLADHVGAYMVRGRGPLSSARVDMNGGIRRLGQNALAVARKCSAVVLRRMALEVLRPLMRELGASDEELQQAADACIRGVDAAMWPAGSVALQGGYADGVTLQPDLDAARQQLEANSRERLPELIQQALIGIAAKAVRQAIEPVLLPEERAELNQNFWVRRGEQIVPDGTGSRFVNGNSSTKQRILNEVRNNLGPALRTAARYLLVFRCNHLLARHNVDVEPPLRESDMTDAERDRFTNADNPAEALAVMKDFLVRQDRVVDAVAEELGMAPPDLPSIPSVLPAAEQQRLRAEREQMVERWRETVRNAMRRW